MDERTGGAECQRNSSFLCYLVGGLIASLRLRAGRYLPTKAGVEAVWVRSIVVRGSAEQPTSSHDELPAYLVLGVLIHCFCVRLAVRRIVFLQSSPLSYSFLCLQTRCGSPRAVPWRLGVSGLRWLGALAWVVKGERGGESTNFLHQDHQGWRGLPSEGLRGYSSAMGKQIL